MYCIVGLVMCCIVGLIMYCIVGLILSGTPQSYAQYSKWYIAINSTLGKAIMLPIKLMTELSEQYNRRKQIKEYKNLLNKVNLKITF